MNAIEFSAVPFPRNNTTATAAATFSCVRDGSFTATRTRLNDLSESPCTPHRTFINFRLYFYTLSTLLTKNPHTIAVNSN